MDRTTALLCTPLLVLALAGCGKTTSTAGFKGEAHEVAQAISNFQSDATARSEQKICKNELVGAVVTRLDGVKEGCKQALKNQLAEVDNFELNVQSVQVNASSTPPTATAQVKSVRQGKSRPGTLTLVKEGGRWKISGIQ